MNTLKYNAYLLVIALTSLLAACHKSNTDIHNSERAVKPYEAADVSSMNVSELIEYLGTLSEEMSIATAQSEYIEMHYLEIALSKALAALEERLPSTARSKLSSQIDTLKIIAVKIHEAGHDQNASMAATLNKTLNDKTAELRVAIVDLTESDPSN